MEQAKNIDRMNMTNAVNNSKKKIEDSTLSSNIAILGINQIALKIVRKPNGSKKTTQNIVGFIQFKEIDQDINLAKLPDVLGNIDDIKQIIKKNNIEKVLLAIDPDDIQNLHQAIQYCEKNHVSYEILPRTYDSLSKLDDFSEPEDLIDQGQRVVDLAVSVVMFILFLPSLALVALAIRLESRGSVLYSQERAGKDGKVFKIYKFRSMYTDAEKHSGPQLATRNDPRITKIGRILRKTRLDEIPQLINVIKGDMSLIGPRPERPFFIEKYRKEIPSYVERLKVKPGLTGLAQIETGYDESIEDVKQKVKHDIHYINNRKSLSLYFKILYKTIWVVLTAKGQ